VAMRGGADYAGEALGKVKGIKVREYNSTRVELVI